MSAVQGEQRGPVRSQALCQSCYAPIVWARTVTGKRIPLDIAPVLNGNMILDGRVARVVTPYPDLEARVSHFATCPNAYEHRKAR